MTVRLDRPMLLLLGLAALAILWLGWRFARWWRGFRLGQSRRRGARGESRARKLLERAGYVVLAEQEAAVGFWLVDGERREFDLRADAVVEKNGQRLVVEIKTGAAASTASRGTRRQLLEYAYAFGLDGVLLVDMAEERIHRVDFPGLRK